MFLCTKKAHGKHGRSLKCDMTIVTLYLGINEAWGSGSLVKLVSAEYERNGNSLSDSDRFCQVHRYVLVQRKGSWELRETLEVRHDHNHTVTRRQRLGELASW